MGRRARPGNFSETKFAIVGQAHRLPFRKPERLPHNDLLKRDGFLRFLYKFFEARIAAQRIPVRVQL